MNTAIINIKTDPKVKSSAQRVADDLGLSLSGVINAYLKQLIRTKTVHYSANPETNPTPYLLQALAEAEQDRRQGKVSPRFRSSHVAIQWLHNPKRKYQK